MTPSPDYDVPDSECDCSEHVPADLGPDDFWTCPKCDAVWYGEEDQPQ